jgi:hypothetical protein
MGVGLGISLKEGGNKDNTEIITAIKKI